MVKINNLLRCRFCNKKLNRDRNSVFNIVGIIESHILGYERPDYLKRGRRRGEVVNDNDQVQPQVQAHNNMDLD